MHALLTDLYQLNMAASYLRRGMSDRATFSLFARTLPPNRGFLVASGIESCLDALEQLRFDEDELSFLATVPGLAPGAAGTLRDVRFTGDVWAVPEGRIIFAGAPLVEVTAPIAEAQLIETYLLNRTTFETTIASKAARCVLAARGRDLVEFSFRRTQGIEAGIDVARLCGLVGFLATSNVEAARRHGLTAAGTVAHSYIEAFPSEIDAFRALAVASPDRVTFLVDTYDTLVGVGNAVRVIKELQLSGELTIRLDSGDLAHLARAARDLLDDQGLPQVRIFASGGLDELEIERLVAGGAPIDAFGVGTKLGVSADHPYLDTVYKLVQYGRRPVMKLSTGKATQPGPKQVFRGAPGQADLIGLRTEPTPPGRQQLLEPAMRNGRRLSQRPSLAASRARFESDLRWLPTATCDLRRPQSLLPQPTEALVQLTETTRSSLH